MTTLTLILLAVLAAGAPDFTRASGKGNPRTMVTMPDVMRRTRKDAEAAVRGAGIRGEIHLLGDPAAADAYVCNQVPSPGGQTAPTYGVDLTLCARDRFVKTEPELGGLSVADATKTARASGHLGKIEIHKLGEWDDSCKPEMVCRVSPVRWGLDRDATLELWINKTL